MGCTWNIKGTLKPFKENTAEFLAAMKKNCLDYSDLGNGCYSVQYDGYGHYGDKYEIMIDLVGIVESGKIRFARKDLDVETVMYTFHNGEYTESGGQRFLYFEGIDDPLVFAQSLPDSVIQTILAHAGEFHHD